MKKLFFLFAILAIIISATAQDIIVTNESKKIEAKITEVSKSEIKYKKFDYQDGPTFILSTDDIVTIIYANGEVVLYKNEESQKEKEAVEKANAMGSLFGTTTETSTHGTPVGQGQSGNSWALSGRGIKGTLPRPSNNFKQEGKVVVQIRVNADGDVTSATIIGGNVNDAYTQQLAVDAAKKAKFTKGDHEQIGTITYNFKFK